MVFISVSPTLSSSADLQHAAAPSTDPTAPSPTLANTLAAAFAHATALAHQEPGSITYASPGGVAQPINPLPAPGASGFATPSSAAANSTAWQQFAKDHPRHPSFPNSTDREAVSLVIFFAFAFVCTWSVAALYFVDRVEKFRPGETKSLWAALPLVAP